MTTSQSSHRASLLAGLRTGGVRSVSVPHTAGPQGSFVVPQPHITNHHYQSSYLAEDEMDGLAQMMSNGAHISQHRYAQPRTANDLNSLPLAQQQQYWNGTTQNRVNEVSHDGYPMTAYNANPQELQLQMMQMELMRLQVNFRWLLRVVWVDLIDHLQALSQLQQYTQFRNDNQQGLPQTAYQPNVGAGYQGQNVPMTAAIGGKFGRRPSYNGPFEDETNLYANRQANSLSQSSGLVNHAILKDSSGLQNVAPSKSDSAISWRKASADPVLTRDDISNPRRSPLPRRQRPEPLELRGVSNVVSDHDTESNPSSREATESSNDSSSTKSDGEPVSSTPTTPVSGKSNGSLSAAREEASKKLFQGLGLGRPSIHITAPSVTTLPAAFLGERGSVTPATAGTPKPVSIVIRQPRGPPASAEELSTKNFANRIRKKAIGGLGALLEARERREGIPAQELYDSF